MSNFTIQTKPLCFRATPDLWNKVLMVAKANELPVAVVVRQSVRLGLPIFAEKYPQPEPIEQLVLFKEEGIAQ